MGGTAWIFHLIMYISKRLATSLIQPWGTLSCFREACICSSCSSLFRASLLGSWVFFFSFLFFFYFFCFRARYCMVGNRSRSVCALREGQVRQRRKMVADLQIETGHNSQVTTCFHHFKLFDKGVPYLSFRSCVHSGLRDWQPAWEIALLRTRWWDSGSVSVCVARERVEHLVRDGLSAYQHATRSFHSNFHNLISGTTK